MLQDNIRNFCIIAHIDHGKSTLADRFIELTNAVSPTKMREQVLDNLDLERERGITIKAKAVRLLYKPKEGKEYHLNLIDTPGHVDFSYEVSRTLAACEGAILVIDATQGIQAQTLANVYLAMDRNLEIIPVINKIDLPGAEPQRVLGEIESVLGYSESDVLLISAKTGQGVPQLLEEVIRRVPPPGGNPSGPLRALVFDSYYDSYKGVVLCLRVVDGEAKTGDRLRLMGHGTEIEALEIGYFIPGPQVTDALLAGEVGYLATGLKDIASCPVGDTVTLSQDGAETPLIGYRPAKSMVFAGLYPAQTDQSLELREALDKLRLNDASLTYTPESSPVMGQGFRCGFLGLLHLDIVVERLEREFGLPVVVTAPAVTLRVTTTSGEVIEVINPTELPSPSKIAKLEEPWIKLSVITPFKFIGPLMEFIKESGGVYKNTEYLGEFSLSQQRVRLEYELPLRAMLTTFYDSLKALSQGYVSLDYEFIGYKETKLVKMDVLVNGVLVDAFSRVVPEEKAYQAGRDIVGKLRETIPRQLFDVAIQAAIGSRIIARAEVKAKRKDVLAKCYGGDITRKMKLLEKQKEGKKRMKMIGRVEVPREAFVDLLKIGT
jgi:GTP-binding protein LepA